MVYIRSDVGFRKHHSLSLMQPGVQWFLWPRVRFPVAKSDLLLPPCRMAGFSSLSRGQKRTVTRETISISAVSRVPNAPGKRRGGIGKPSSPQHCAEKTLTSLLLGYEG